jgi:hypothetical protein
VTARGVVALPQAAARQLNSRMLTRSTDPQVDHLVFISRSFFLLSISLKSALQCIDGLRARKVPLSMPHPDRPNLLLSQAYELSILPVQMEARVECLEAIVQDGPIADLENGPLMLEDD